MRKAKIVDTIGPATSSLETLTELVKAGMDVARINRSHGTFDEHVAIYNNIREAGRAAGKDVAVLVDLQGPKIRCGWIEKDAEGEDKVQLDEGQEFVITTDDITGNKDRVSTTFKGLPADCNPGDPILIEDEEDLRWGIRTGADLIAMSFVRFASDIDRAHAIMDEEGRRVPVIAKIEKPQAVENLEEIVKAFDGIMVARGDMAVEMPFEQVPLITKRCIELSRNYGKPVIVATEVLGSMVHSPVPTRAEASDCANAVLDGADATMTSNETAVGDYPVVTVDTMSRISSYATEHGYDRIPGIRDEHYTVSSAVAHSAVELASKLDVDAIVAFTRTGATVHRISAERPQAPIFGLTTDAHTKSFLNLSWGTQGIQLGRDYHGLTRAELMQLADEAVKGTGRLEDGDTIVVVSCSPAATEAGSTDSVYVHVIGHED